MESIIYSVDYVNHVDVVCTAVMFLSISAVYRVRTDPGKVWKVLEFNVEIFKVLKSLENDHRYGKVWRNP